MNEVCEYCRTLNPREAKTCLACGAPTEMPRPSPRSNLELEPRVEVTSPNRPEEAFKKAGEKVDEAYFAVLNSYSIAWRTLAEAIAIAAAAFIIGISGGAAEARFLGILGGVALGIAVGLTQKNFYITLVSAPGGALIGLALGAAFWVVGSQKIFPLIVAISSIVGAVIGGRRQPTYAHRNWWGKLRPLLGGLGGLAFGILGALLGWGIWGALALFK